MRGKRLASVWLGVAFLPGVGRAQVVSIDTPPPTTVHGESSADFATHLHRLQAQVQACKASAKACDADAGLDDKVSGSPAGDYTVRWDWLRNALQDAGKASPEERAEAMDKSAAHLDELATEAGIAPDSGGKAHNRADIPGAEQKAEEVLSRSDFNQVAGPTWWERMVARVENFVGRLFMGVGMLGAKAPWLGTLVEWSLFLGAAVLLLLMVQRIFARQRMQVGMAGAAQLGAWSRESQDWATEAESWAERGEWREAVHCLYWAAIVRLEARRAWRHNPSRTPREYVRLLKPGSAQQSALRILTGIFERVWYGLRDAQAADYQKARTLFDGLGEPAREQAASEPAA